MAAMSAAIEGLLEGDYDVALTGITSKSGAPLDNAAVKSAIADAEAQLDGRGRLVIRKSGTEPLIRVMAEAPTQDETDAACERLRAVVAETLGPKFVG